MVFDASVAATAADVVDHSHDSLADPASTAAKAGQAQDAAKAVGATEPAGDQAPAREPGADHAAPAGSDLPVPAAGAAPAKDDSAQPANASTGILQLVFVDPRTPGAAEAVAGLGAGTRVVTLDSGRDGIQQISEALSGTSGLQSIHILSHGDGGGLPVGRDTLTTTSLTGRADEVASWRDHLADGATIELHGVDPASGGQRLAGTLADLTGSKVTATDDLTVPDADKADAGGADSVTAADRRIVVIDARVENPEVLLGDLPSDVETVVIGVNDDPIARIQQALAGGHVASLQIVAHGEAGSVTLGRDTLTAASLEGATADAIAAWKASFTEGADILLLGCDVGQGGAGTAFMARLAGLTGTDVAASDDATGSAALGGDWTLEVSTGPVESRIALSATAEAAWQHLLAPPTITSPAGGDTIAVIEPSVLNVAGAEQASLGGWTVTDLEGGTLTVTVSLPSTTVGHLDDTAPPGNKGVSFLSFNGTAADANIWLAGLRFVAADTELGNTAASTTITITVIDGDPSPGPYTVTKTIAVTVSPSNDPTVLTTSQVTVTEGGNVEITAGNLTVADPEVTAGTQSNTQLVYRLEALPAYGTLTLGGQLLGVGSIFTQDDVVNHRLVYVHKATGADQNTADSFQVSVNDGATPQSYSSAHISTVNIAVTPVNQAPVLTTAGGNVYEGVPASAPESSIGNFIVANAGGDPGDTLTIQLSSLPQHGSLIFTGTLTINGVTRTLTNQNLATYVIPGGTTLDLGSDTVLIAQDQLSGLHYAHDGTEPTVAPTDSFNVVIKDAGGGTGVSASLSQAITLTIRPVNDDPTWVESSTRTATVTAGGADGNLLTGGDNFRVTLTTAMMNVTDSDSPPSSITFAVVDSPSYGRILRNGAVVESGGTFSLQDVIDGRVVYLQTAVNMAGTLGSDDFTFAVSDNAMALRWNADGTSFSRQGGIYAGPSASDSFRIFGFSVALAQGAGASTASYIASAGTPSLAEGDSGTQTVTFTVTRVGDISTTGSVQYTVGGVDGADVSSLLSGTALFAAYESTVEIRLTLVGDTVVEPDEVMTVTLSNPVQGQIAVGSASTTIVNDDTGLSVSIAPVSATQFEGNSGTRSYTFTITRAGVTTGTTTVDYVIEGAGDYPASASDFAGGTFPFGTVTFLASETVKTVTVEVQGDAIAEADETFRLRLANPAGGVLTTATALASIVDDDPAPGLSIKTDAGSVSVLEGDSGTRTLTFTVTRTGKLGQATTVDWTVVGVSGVIDAADFGQAALPQGTITFAAGETVKTITVSVAGDQDIEDDETFKVQLSNPTNGTLETPDAQATIVDDDPATLPEVSISAVTSQLAEGDSGAVAFTFVVTRTGNTSQPGSVDWAVGGGAVNAADFYAGVLPSGTITFAANEVSRTISVIVRGDTLVETDEAFTVTLSNERYLSVGTRTATATILNDDSVPTLSIRANQGAMVEGNSGTRNFTFTVTRSTSAGAAGVDWTIGGMVDAADFGGTIPFGHIDFLNGETTKTITIAVSGDTQAELDETLTVTLSNASGARIATAAATSLIVNDDYPYATVAITADLNQVAEGNSGTRAITYTVTRTGDTTGAASVAWSITGGTADAADFLNGVLPSGTVTFGANETSKTFQIFVAGDTTIEPDETFTVTLSNPNGVSIANNGGSATARIINDDGQIFTIAADQIQRAEGNSGTTPFTFTVTRTGDSSADVTLNWAVSGPGIDDADFVGGTKPFGTVTILAGHTTATITVNVAGDTVAEANEGFTVTLSNPSAGTIATATASSVIANDDGTTLPQFDIVAVNGSQVEGGTGTSRSYQFTITRTGNIGGSASVDWTVAGGAVNPANAADFGGFLPHGTLTFNPGETSQTIVVTVNGDLLAEPDESFTVTLGNAQGAAIGTGVAEATILDDDPVPHVAIVDAGLVKLEGNSGVTTFTFTVTRTGSTADSTSVVWQLTGDAVNAADFGGALPSGTVVFAAGETSATITVSVTGDTAQEGDEPFTVTLLSASNGIIDHATATATILNDDPDIVPTVAIAATDASKAEGNGGTTSYTFTVTRSGDTSSTSFVNWTLRHTSTDAADVTSPTSGRVEFAAGETTATITITVNGDLLFEGDESFDVVLTSAVGARIATGGASASGTVLNDDPAPPSVSITTPTVAAYEGQSGTTPFTFTVTRTGDLTRATTVAWSVVGSGGVPALASDFENGVLPSGTVTFAAGAATATITVNVAGDITVETNETFTVQLISASNGTVSGTGATAVGTIRNDDAPPPPSADPSQILFVGQNPNSAVNAGTITEGSTTGGLILGNDGDNTTPVMLSYSAAGASATQVVYTVLKLGANDGDWYGTLQLKVNGSWQTLSAYGTFTQADLDAGNVRFVPSDGEGFLSTFQFSVSTGAVDPVTRAPVRTVGTFSVFTTPVNDAPTATGSTDKPIKEGDTSYITTSMLSFADPDDATNESYLENPAAGIYASNFALNHTADNPLQFRVTALPAHGTLEVYINGQWAQAQVGTLYNVSLLTISPGGAGTTGLRYNHNGGETRADAFTVVAVDRWGLASSPATVSFVLTNVNDGPQIAATPAQADPTIGVDAPNAIGGAPTNDPITVEEGSRVQITAAMLQAYDPDSSAVQVQYRLTTATSYGQLMRSTNGTTFTVIGVGSSFTQQDVANGTIYYVHGGGESYQSNPSTTYDDRFVFTLSDGDKEQTGREAWVYITPVNQAPTLTSPTGDIPVVSTTIGNNPIAGFVAADPDITSSPGYQSTDRSNPVDETNIVTAIVRLRDVNNLLLADYTGITIQPGAGATVTLIDPPSGPAYDGNGRVLVMKGSLAQVNAALAGLHIGFATDRNAYYTVEVIIDDRARADDGTLTGGANGGLKNASGSVSVPNTAVPGTNPDFTSGDFTGLTGNVAIGTVRIFASSSNDQPTIGLPGAIQPTEDVRIQVIGSGRTVDFDDIEARLTNSNIQVTLSAAHGAVDVGTEGAADSTGTNVTITGDGTGTVTVTGKIADVKAFLNAGVWYLGDGNYNGADTLTVTVSDLGTYGAGSGSSNVTQVAQGTIALTDFVDVNDDPTLNIGSGQIVIDRSSAVTVTGFPALALVIADADDPAQTGQEVQVIVRLLNGSGAPLADAAAYSGITIGYTLSGSAAVVNRGAGAFDGAERPLILRGKITDVAATLQSLKLTVANSNGERDDTTLTLQVIVDDRTSDTSGTASATANGGAVNQQLGGPAGTPTAIVATVIDPYATTTATLNDTAGLAPNTVHAERSVYISGVNDPVVINAGNVTKTEGVTTIVLNATDGAFTLTDADTNGATNLTATVTTSVGTFTAVGGTAGKSALGLGTITLTGSLAAIESSLRDLTITLPDPDGAGGPASNADWNGTFTVTVAVRDLGNTGQRPGDLSGMGTDVASNPGQVSYTDGSSAGLTTTRTITVTIANVNDAPIRSGNATVTTLPNTQEDTADPPGAKVDTLFSGSFSDAVDGAGTSGANQFYGVAVVSSGTVSGGVWQYRLDIENDGTLDGTWVTIGNQSTSSALILDKYDAIRFLPDANWFGTPTGLTVQLIDNSGTTPTSGTIINIGAGGGATAYSDSSNAVTLMTSVVKENDRPTASNTSLPNVAEDAPNPSGTAISNLFTGKYSDAADDQSAHSGDNDSTPLAGIAIVGNTTPATQGVWQYLYVAGGVTTWTTIAANTYSDASALILPAAAQLRFLPGTDFNGTVTPLSVRVADGEGGAITAVTSGVNLTGSLGATSRWSGDGTTAIGVTVTPRNDAPTITATAIGSPIALSEAAGVGTGSSSQLLVTVSAVDDAADFQYLANDNFGGGVIGATMATWYSGDTLTIVDGTYSGKAVTYASASGQVKVGGTVVGTLAGGSSGTALTITLNANADAGAVQAVIQAIAYRTTSDNPTANGTYTSRTVNFTFRDGANNNQSGGSALSTNPSPFVSATIQFTPVNDPPVADLNGAGNGSDNAVTFIDPANANPSAVNIAASATLSDPDNSNLSSMHLTVGGLQDGAFETLTIGGVSFTLNQDCTDVAAGAFKVSYVASVGTGTGTFTIRPGSGNTATVAAFQALLQGITYLNTDDDPTGTSRTVDVTVTDANDDDASATGLNSNTPRTTITIQTNNDQPRITGLSTAATFNEDAIKTAARLDADGVITLDDADSTAYNNGTLTVTGMIAGEDHVSIPAAASAPANPVTNQIWRDTSGSGVYAYDGTAWVQIGTVSTDTDTNFTITL
ncbi:Calx-beta domain-containing protein, partial [Azospirillum rugosum]